MTKRESNLNLAVAEQLLSAPPRASERIDLSCEVTLTSDSNFFRGVTENVSEGGVFVATEGLLPPGTIVNIVVSLGQAEPIRTKAIVRWRRPATAPEGPGIGLQFVELARGDAVRIGRFAARRPPMYWDPPRESEPAASEAPPSQGLPREIALRYVPIIRSLALRLARRLPPHILVDDLVGVGFVGLVEAYRHYDPMHRDRFDAFAQVRIRGAMLDELRALDPLSREDRRFARRVNDAVARLEVALGRGPEEHEIAEALGVPLDTFRSRTATMAKAARGDLNSAAGIADPFATAADDEVAKAEALKSIATAFEGLPPRLRQILDLYYGDELTLRDIGSVLGVTEGRVCQLHGEAIERLRAGALDRSAPAQPLDASSDQLRRKLET